MLARFRIAWIASALLLAVLAVGTGLAYVSGSPALCAQCHEMKQSVETWSTSPHARVRCPSCHESPRPWYRFPETLATRAAMLNRDVIAHVSERTQSSTDGPGIHGRPIPDTVCRNCHDLSRAVTVRRGTIMDHAKHAERNKSCTSCHLLTAHPGAESERRLALMSQCFQCHGSPNKPTARGTCDACHPPGFKLRPSTHEPAPTWRKRHGKSATPSRRLCTYCHKDSYCRDCHGVEMPHPPGWAKGAASHASIAQKDRSTCVRCHNEQPDFCSACHHKDFDPARGSWVVQHRHAVKKRGASFCLDCHSTVFCPYCHTRARVRSTSATSSRAETATDTSDTIGP